MWRTVSSEPPEDLVAVLRRLGLGGDRLPPMVPLTGGVSSDIWRVDLPGGPVCVKRALARLKVAATWQAPLERTGYEAAWMEVASRACPGICPDVVAYDAESGVLVMSYLDPEHHRLWKHELRDGRADPDVAAEVARRVATVHRVTAGDAKVAAAFDNLDVFTALRLEPYLDATARAHPDLAGTLDRVRAAYVANRRALVHGDVSPKNILVGSGGPVLVDAECATWGDPAFDVAFCATHLLLKCRWSPAATAQLLVCFDRFAATYLGEVTWEPAAALDRRVAAMTAALLLARVDGKSPVEYLDEAGRESTRACARSMLAGVDRAPGTLAEVRERWEDSL